VFRHNVQQPFFFFLAYKLRVSHCFFIIGKYSIETTVLQPDPETLGDKSCFFYHKDLQKQSPGAKLKKINSTET
jgi:hypothetical protein